MHRVAFTLLAGFILSFAVPAAGAEPDSDPGELVAAQDGDTTAVEPGADGEDPEAESRPFDAEHRRQIYEANRISPWRTVGYSALFPGVGNFYVEQYAVGTIALSAMVFAGMFAGFGLVHDQINLLQLAGIVSGLTYVSSGAIAVYGAHSHNDTLRQNLHIDDDYDASLSSPSGPAFGFTVRF